MSVDLTDDLLARRRAVIEASAGTGKTYLIEHLVARLVTEGGLALPEILVVTFTEKATAELVGRLRACLVGQTATGVEVARTRAQQALLAFDRATISTIHGFCNAVLREHAFLGGRAFSETAVQRKPLVRQAFFEELRLLAGDPQRALLLGLLDDADVERLAIDVVECFERMPSFGETDPPLVVPARGSDVPLGAFLEDVVPRVAARVRARKRAEGLIDYDDMLVAVARGLEGPHGPELLASLRARFRAVLIDEFQDTDEVQWRIFKKVFAEAGDSHRLYVIGDPKQSIYGFRGADVDTYLEATRFLAPAAPDVVRLDRSFRTTAALQDGLNTLFDPEARPAFFPGDIKYHRVGCGEPDKHLTGADGAEPSPVVVLRVDGAGDTVRVPDVRRAVSAEIAREIRRLLSPAGRLVLAGKPVEVRDVFVLARTGSELVEVGQALRAAGVPHAFFKQDGLFKTAEAAEVLDLLAALEKPHARSPRGRAYLSAFFGVPLADLAVVAELPASHAIPRRLRRWSALAEARAWSELFASLLDESGLGARELFLRGQDRKLVNYLHVLEVVAAEAARAHPSIGQLRAYLAGLIAEPMAAPGQYGNQQRLETERDAVQIMSVHQSKGLEAAVVFVTGGFGGRGGGGDTKPRVKWARDGHRRRIVAVGRLDTVTKKRDDDAAADEDRRLGYVAVTRAKARVYLPWLPAARSRLQGPYRFLNGRLDALVGPHDRPSARPGFELREVSVDGADEVAAVEQRADWRAAFASWQPPEAAPVSKTAALARIAAERPGVRVSSYTALSARRHADDEIAFDRAVEASGDEAPEGPASNELPRGIASGVFLHEALEKADLALLSGTESGEAWAQAPEVAGFWGALLRKHDVPARAAGHAARLVHTALTSARAAGAHTLPPLASGVALRREWEFVYPVPEAAQPLLDRAAADARFSAERGFLRGFIDVVVEVQGRFFVIDWKSDFLRDPSATALDAHARAHYALQAQIYTLALARMLGVRNAADHEARVGGVVFAFLRTLSASDPRAGVIAFAPTFAEVARWERAMTEPRFLESGALPPLGAAP